MMMNLQGGAGYLLCGETTSKNQTMLIKFGDVPVIEQHCTTID
jgi:hypothetical protein